MADDPQILVAQGDPSVPDTSAVLMGTDLIVAPSRVVDRLQHFSEEVYRLDPETNLVRFLSVILGDAGAGQLRKKYILRRLQQSIYGTHFFDLDRFYGALFGVQRRSYELLDVDPYIGTATADEWQVVQNRDASYRSRIVQFSRALNYGPTPIGMELIAESLFSVDCDVYESFRDVDDGVGGIPTTPDSAPTPHPAFLVGTPPPPQVVSLWDGFGSAFSFDGVSRGADTQGIDCGDSVTGVPPVGGVGAAATFCLEAKIHLPADWSTASIGVIAGRWGGPPAANNVLIYHINTTVYVSAFYLGTQYDATWTGLVAGVSYDIAGTYDGTNLRLFVDGVLRMTTPMAGVTLPTTAAKFMVGRDDDPGSPGAGGYPFHGIIDEVRWSKVSRHTVNYTPPASPFVPDANTLGLWHFDAANRRMFTVRPKRAISQEEHYDAIRVLSRIKPADAFVIVDSAGVAAHLPINLRGVAADSQYWEILSKVQPRTVTTELPYPEIDVNPTEQPRPPFGAYQGEAWTYNGDVAGVSGYYHSDSDHDTPTQQKTYIPNRRKRRQKQNVAYPPEWALSSARDIITGRYISDAIYQAHPYGDRRLGHTDVYVTQDGQVYAILDTGQTVKLGVNYADNIPIPGLLDALRQMPTSTIDPMASAYQHFWVTPERPIESPFEEILEVRLTAPRYVNYISFDVSHYPNVLEVEVFNENTASWQSVYTSMVTDSIPKRPPQSPKAGSTEHPFHPETSGHWINNTARFAQVKTRRIRIVMARAKSTTGWTAHEQYHNTDGGPVRTESASWGGSISLPTTTVSFGSGAELNAFQGYVENVLWPSGTATWYVSTSGPAGNSITYNTPSVSSFGGSYSYDKKIPYSLALRHVEIGFRVTSYAEIPLETATTKDLLGSLVQFELRENTAQQAVDGDDDTSWRSEPQPSSNAVVNFFTDTRDAAGLAQLIDRFYIEPLYSGPTFNLYFSNDDLPDDVVSSNDALNFPILSPTGITAYGDNGITLDSGAASYIDIDNTAVQFDPTFPFHAYIDVVPAFAYNVGNHVLLDLGGYKLRVNGGLISFVHPDGTSASVAVPFPAGADLRIGISGDTSSVVVGVWWNGALQFAAANAVTPSVTQPPTLRIGAPLSGVADAASITLRSLIIKRGAWDNDESFFVLDSISAMDKLGAKNAVVRYLGTWASSTNDYGFKGGPGEFFDLIEWTPIARDYIFQKGFIHFPPTLARFWKFEITNLIAEPYESFIPINRTVKLFPSGTSQETMWQQTNSDPSAGPPGVRAAIDLGDRLFIDNFIDVAQTPDGTSPTVARYFDNPNQRDGNVGESWLYQFQPWHPGLTMPSFPETGVHEYEQIEIRHSSKVAFFCGIKEIVAYRVNYTVDDDTTVYYERFINEDNINSTTHPSTWNLDPNYLHNDATAERSAQSVVFQSKHDVIGVQFATQQSHHVQRLYDHDLKDPALGSYDWLDNDDWSLIGDASISYDMGNDSAIVTRTGESTATGEAPPARVTLVSTYPHPDFRRDYISAADIAAAAAVYGGIQTPASLTSNLGMLYAAARFTAIEDASSVPYHLQIIDATSGVVLADRALPARAGQTIEEFVSYRIGSISAPGVAVRARLYQATKVSSQISVDSIAIFDEGIIWDFSNDGGVTWVTDEGGVRNNPCGMVTFPTPGKQLVWRVRSSLPNMAVTSLQMRPVYAGLRAARPSGILHGPNLSTYDQEPPVANDPEFQGWHKPVPRWWWREANRFPNLPVEGLPVTSVFARFYGRPADDAIAAPVDTASRHLVAMRHGADTTPAVDTAHRGPAFLVRRASDSAPVSGDGATGTKVIAGSRLVTTVPHLPVNDDT